MSTVTGCGPTDRFGSSLLALVRKELRELALPALALVLCAVLIAGTDVLYERLHPMRQVPGFALPVWAVISLVLAFLGGGATIARESPRRLTFLTAWPQSRTRLWVVKAGVGFVLTMAVIGVGFAVCLAPATLREHKLPWDVHRYYGSLLGYLPLSFIFGLLWSGLVRSALGAAALGFATVCALGYGLLGFYWLYLPNEWGPYLASLPQRAWQHNILPLTIPLFVGWWAFTRYPLLEGRRRILVALGLFSALVLLGNATLVTQMALGNRPVLDRSVAETGLVNRGQFRYFLMKAHGNDPGGLWVQRADGGPTKLVARGKVYRSDTAAEALVVTHCGMGYEGGRYTNWSVQFPSLRLHRLPDEPVAQPPPPQIGGAR